MEKFYEVLPAILSHMATNCSLYDIVPIHNPPIFVYIIEGVGGWCYCGQTKDIVKRFLQHNRGESKSTRKNSPYVLKWLFQANGRHKARFIEMMIKQAGVKEFLSRAKYNPARKLYLQ